MREAIQAYLFGATLLVDAFVISFNFPEMIQTLFFSGATSAFLIPVCSRYLNDPEEFSKLYSTFINLALLVTGVVSLGFLVLSGDIMRLIAPGFAPETKRVAYYLFIIMIPVITLHALLSVMKAFLNAKEHFAAPELSGVLWNLAFIAAALLLSKHIGIYSLALGVSVGALIQVFYQVPYLRRHGIHYRPSLSVRHPAVDEARRLFTGALIATSIVPINSFVGRIIGSYLPAGEVAGLAYAFRIFILPFSLFAVPAYTVLFSRLSTLHHEGDWEGTRAHIDSALVLFFVTLVPSTIFLCMAGDACIQILYQRGAFTPHDTSVTYRALLGYSTGLLFYALSICFVRVFNAMHDMRTPAIVGLTSIALNALVAWLLMPVLGNLGISLATSLVSCYNFLALYLVFRRRTGYAPSDHAKWEIIKAVTAGIILTGLLAIFKMAFFGRPYLFFAASTLVTLVIYGFFFKDYYFSLLQRRPGTGSAA